MDRIFALIEDGIVRNVFTANDWPGAIDVTNTEPRPAPGWLYQNGAFSAPAQVPIAEASRRITNLAFDLRFTDTERTNIELAGVDDPSASAETRLQAAYIRVSQARAGKALFTELSDPVTRTGVQIFEAFGLIGEGRAAEILDAPIQDRERFE